MFSAMHYGITPSTDYQSYERGLLAITLADSALRKISSGNGDGVANGCGCLEARWSPDGSKILLKRTLLQRNSDLWTIGIDGQGLTRITTTEMDDAEHDWSRDGTKIVFRTHDGVHTIDADGANLTTITAAADEIGGYQTNMSWSPDGSKIAFNAHSDDGTGRRDIWVMNSDGTGSVNLTINHPRLIGGSAEGGSNPDYGP